MLRQLNQFVGDALSHVRTVRHVQRNFALKLFAVIPADRSRKLDFGHLNRLITLCRVDENALDRVKPSPSF